MTAWNKRRIRISCLATVFTVWWLGLAVSFAEDRHDHMPAEVDGLVVSHAMSPVAAPGIKTSAVYFTLKNDSSIDCDLVAVESPAFAMAHIHKTAMADGLMTMEPVAQLTIPHGEHVTFAPGSLHVMLMGAKATFKPGDRFMLTLRFGSGTELEVPVDVVTPGEVSGDTHDHGHMKMN